MEDRYTLKFKKGTDATVDSYTTWSIVCCKVPFKVGARTKELPKREWFDENGDDTYIPSSLKFEGYDAEFELAYKGKELASNPFDLGLAVTQINAFKNWLAGTSDNKSELKIYSPYSTIGRQGCYLLEITDEEPIVQTVQDSGNVYNENVVTFKVKFRVTDPSTDITL